MDFYRDIRYLNYQDGEHNVENIGSVKFFLRENVGKADVYIKKVPCLYPVECKLMILKGDMVAFSRWIQIDKQNWQNSFEFFLEQPYEDVRLKLEITEKRKVCEREKKPDTRKELERLYEDIPVVRMQQISRDEIESVPFRNMETSFSEQTKKADLKNSNIEKSNGSDKDTANSSPTVHPNESDRINKKAVKIAGSENEYYMSRISELGELSKDLEPLEHNSFLLHGYFNYKHLLIRKEGERFLVGVPGNYYYREEMVAAMFGFPNFVPAKREDGKEKDMEELFWEEEKKVGEFGYYFEEV